MFCLLSFFSRSVTANDVLFFLIEQFVNCNELSDGEILSSLKINDGNEEEIELFSPKELDEILKSFPINLINHTDNETSNIIFDFDIQNCLIDPQIINNDDLFVEMLLDNDYSLPTTNQTTSENLFYSNSSSSLPRITSVDEFDAFLRDFTQNLSSHQQEVSTPIS